ncbi:cinnamoyl-CoA reductase 1-like [Zingiber officinale]|uniref:cinnamoyl-CoA reductase 1-like n=1 Tax=Zingiber officinale TaxID=94328 RepID=UPI001C4C9007|nr:cinnamoyl-CoA reductase 1-like [Zingiber officinale]
MDPAAEKKRMCVTGAGGFIASWLVKLLLSKGYIVHGTVRDPSDPKNAHLKELHPTATDNLKLFKVDLLDYESVASAIAGCEGVFHVASPVPFARVPNPETEVIEPAVTGTLNVLKACSEAKVKRVVVVSSIVAVVMSPDAKGKILDESAWSDAEYCRKTESWYCLSKTLAEREAMNYGEKHGLDVVSVCPSYVIGPLLQPTVNASSLFLINILNGTHSSMEDRLFYLVDVRDVADALFLVYEKPEASGRHSCAPYEVKMPDLIDMLRSLYPNYKYPEKFTEAKSYRLRSEKLEKLGLRYRTMKESLIDTVECYRNAGLMDSA